MMMDEFNAAHRRWRKLACASAVHIRKAVAAAYIHRALHGERAGRNRPTARQAEHLEAAPALADESGDATTGDVIECALDALRAGMWPGNVDLPPARRQSS